MENDSDIVSIPEAVRLLAKRGIFVSTSWIYGLWNDGKITHYEREIDEKRYVSVEEIADKATPKPRGA